MRAATGSFIQDARGRLQPEGSACCSAAPSKSSDDLNVNKMGWLSAVLAPGPAQSAAYEPNSV